MKIDSPLFQALARPNAPAQDASEARRAFAAMLSAARQPAPTRVIDSPAIQGTPAQVTSQPAKQPDPSAPMQRPGRVIDIRV